MLRRFLTAAVAGLLLSLLPVLALAAIGTPTLIGTATQSASAGNPLVITTTVAANVGELLWVDVAASGSNTINNITDSAGGNTWTVVTNFNNGTTANIRGFWTVVSNQIPSGGTISIQFSSTVGRHLAAAVTVTGLAAGSPFDQIGAGAGATSQILAASPILTTGTLAQPTSIVFTMVYLNDALASGDVWIEGSGFTTYAGTLAADGRTLRSAYKIVSATTAVSYAPQNSASRAWIANYVVFNTGGAAATTAAPTLGLLQVGQ